MTNLLLDLANYTDEMDFAQVNEQGKFVCFCPVLQQNQAKKGIISWFFAWIARDERQSDTVGSIEQVEVCYSDREVNHYASFRFTLAS